MTGFLSAGISVDECNFIYQFCLEIHAETRGRYTLYPLTFYPLKLTGPGIFDTFWPSERFPIHTQQ